MTAVAKLLPCPFCGYDMSADEDGAYQKAGFIGAQTPVWAVTCAGTDCNASVETTSAERSVAAWNRRAALSPAELGGVEGLPPLPTPALRPYWANTTDYYSAAQMLNFARAAVLSTPRAAEAVTEYRWRSVSDDLPERTGWYIGINYGVVEPLRWDGNNWHHTRVTRDLAMPSHWRPLPAPPSAKGE